MGRYTPCTVFGRTFDTQAEAARHHGVPITLAKDYRKRRGITYGEAIELIVKRRQDPAWKPYRSCAKSIVVFGVKYETLAEARKFYNVSETSHREARINHGLSDDAALEFVVKARAERERKRQAKAEREEQRRSQRKCIAFGVEYDTPTQAARANGMVPKSVMDRMQRTGQTIEEAINAIRCPKPRAAPKRKSRPKPAAAANSNVKASAKATKSWYAPTVFAPSASYSDDERAAIEAALRAGKVRRFENGEWPDTNRPDVWASHRSAAGRAGAKTKAEHQIGRSANRL